MRKFFKFPSVYILPTPSGIYFICVTFILLIISFSYSHSLAYVTTFLFFSLICLSAFITNSNMKNISLAKLTKNQYYGYEDEQTWNIIVQNTGDQKKYGISLGNIGKTDKPIQIGFQKTQKLHFQTSFTKGIHEFHRVKLSSHFPFGLFKAWIVENTQLQFFTAPKRENKTRLSIEDFAYEDGQGEDQSRIKQGKDEFIEYKQYQQGDPVSNIDWKKSSQHNIYVKSYGEKSLKSYLIDEKIISGQVNSREEILTTMSYFVELINRNDVNYAIKIDQIPTPFNKGRKHWERIIERLAN